jgi:HD superfamily phosphohydrolase
VWLFPEEVEVVNHPSFQRLAKVNQLGQTYLVYRGATHKRLEHVLGAVHVIQRMMEAVEHNRQKAIDRNEAATEELSDFEKRFIRLGALLHDIGHIAAGHTVEDELELTGKHDEDPRLHMIFNSAEWANLKGETLAQVIDRAYRQYLPSAATKDSVQPSEVVQVLIRKRSTDQNDAIARRMNAVENSVKGHMRIEVCRDMIGNTICADLLDYLHRDWYHVGKPRPFDERILQYMEIRQDSTPHSNQKPEQFFVISLGRRPNLRTDAISNILDLLEWRYQLAESVLFHRTKLAAAAMLDRALHALWGNDSSSVERTLFPLSDEQLVSTCKEVAIQKKNQAAADLLKKLETRHLYKAFDTLFYGDRHSIDMDRIKLLYAGVVATGEHHSELVRRAAANRSAAAAALERDFGLPEGSIAIYCPAKVNAKIAQVRIAIEDQIAKFNEYEQRHQNHLSGGHLDAQLKRFEYLWRVHIFIDPEVKESLGAMATLLRDAVRRLVFGFKDVTGEAPDVAARHLARLLAVTEESPWMGKEVSEAPLYGAYKDQTSMLGEYPTGSPTIKSFFEI